jgi:nucleoside-diphosphate-sugar epimerase
MTSLLLVGCGDIALRLAPALADRFTLTGLRRNPAELPDFILPLAADVTEASGLEAVLRHRRFDYAVITLTPGERTEARYRKVYVEGTANILKVLSPDTRVLFVSSTSVYGQDAGEHVTEDSPVGGAGFSGRLLTEAENVVAASGRPFTCVRCSGIYGSGREHLLQKIREGRVDARSAAHVSNRIHADDVAGVLDF